MTDAFHQRLNKVLPRLRSTELLNNKGLSNEIGFYIFDYAPEDELQVREFLDGVILPGLNKGPDPVRTAHINLFQLILDVLSKRDLLERAVSLQAAKGDKEVLRAMKGPLEPAKLAQELVKDIDLTQTDLVLLTGVGGAYGNLEHVINWENDGEEIKLNPSSGLQGRSNYFSEGITWSKLSSSAG